MSKFSQLQAFVAVVETGSFTAAGNSLGMSKSYISQQVSRLEKRLGSQLLYRTTRKQSATASGQRFYEQARSILDALDEAEEQASATSQTLKGPLRISVPLSFGVLHLRRCFAQFAVDYPEVSLAIEFSDRLVDVVGEGFDLAIRLGPLRDPSQRVRRLGQTRLVTLASPGWLKAHGPIGTPEDLKGKPCLRYSGLTTGDEWHYQRANEQVRVRVTGPLLSDNGSMLVTAAERGLGAVRIPDFFLCDEDNQERKDHELMRILREWEVTSPISSISPERRLLSTKVRTAIEFVHTWLREHVPVTQGPLCGPNPCSGSRELHPPALGTGGQVVGPSQPQSTCLRKLVGSTHLTLTPARGPGGDPVLSKGARRKGF